MVEAPDFGASVVASTDPEAYLWGSAMKRISILVLVALLLGATPAAVSAASPCQSQTHTLYLTRSGIATFELATAVGDQITVTLSMRGRIRAQVAQFDLGYLLTDTSRSHSITTLTAHSFAFGPTTLAVWAHRAGWYRFRAVWGAFCG